MTVERWAGCYDESWRDLISPDSFSHPAKMSRGLIVRIFDELLRGGALARGDTVLDPFGGIGTTAIEGASRGMQVVCVELEEKFVTLARQNVEGHRLDWRTFGFPMPVVLQGDSRNLRQVLHAAGVAAVVASPPHGSSGLGHGGGSSKIAHDSTGTLRTMMDDGYGSTPGQIGELPEGTLDTVVSSPPYAEAKAHPSLGHPEKGGSDGQLAHFPTGSVSAVVASPPYAEIQSGAGGLNTKPGKNGQQVGRSADSPSQATDQRYGDSDGQVAKLPAGEVDAVLGSPPYEESVHASGHGIDWSKMDPKTTGNRQRGDDCKHGQTLRNQLAYGETEGQIGSMKGGSVDAVLGSPPYSTGCIREGSDTDSAAHLEGSDNALVVPRPGIRTGSVDAVVASPPFLDARSHVSDKGSIKGSTPTAHDPEAMGVSDGNLQAMRAGDVDAIVSSPPFGFHAGGGGINTHGYRKDGTTGPSDDKVGERTYQGTAADRSPGNLETLVLGALDLSADAIVASPPYEGSLHASTNGIDWEKAKTGNDGGSQTPGKSYANCKHQFQDSKHCLLCGWEPTADDFKAIEDAARSANHELFPVLQLPDGVSALSDRGDAVHGALLPAALVSSPPYENIERANHAPGESARRAREGRADQNVSYGLTPGNIGNVEGETFWSAALQIVRESFAVLKAGGTAVWVVKAFVRDGQIVDFPGDWRKLCEHVGFETTQEVHAMLVAEESRPDLFDGATVKRRERKSFFRRLAEKKGSPRIDWETVYFMRKPC